MSVASASSHQWAALASAHKGSLPVHEILKITNSGLVSRWHASPEAWEAVQNCQEKESSDVDTHALSKIRQTLLGKTQVHANDIWFALQQAQGDALLSSYAKAAFVDNDDAEVQPVGVNMQKSWHKTFLLSVACDRLVDSFYDPVPAGDRGHSFRLQADSVAAYEKAQRHELYIKYTPFLQDAPQVCATFLRHMMSTLAGQEHAVDTQHAELSPLLVTRERTGKGCIGQLFEGIAHGATVADISSTIENLCRVALILRAVLKVSYSASNPRFLSLISL